MHFYLSFTLCFIVLNFSLAQSPLITPAVIPAPGEIYTYKFIKQTTSVDTAAIGENILWDFRKVKDTAVYYDEVYREPLPSQNDVFDDIYSVDSNSIRSELAIWMNYLDSFGYYRLGAFEKPTAPMSEIPYIYDDTMVVLKFPFGFGQQVLDRYEFVKGGYRHHKSQYVDVNIKCDAYGTLILPNNDTCYQSMRIRREENFFNIVNEVPQPAGTKVYFYWYSAIKQNYFLKLTYINGRPIDAWYLKKRGYIKKKRNYD